MEATKEMIAKTAVELFQKEGVDNVSIQAICDACDVTRNAFYYHFKNKQDLILQFFNAQTIGDEAIFAHMMTLPNDWERFWYLCEYDLKAIESMGKELTRQYFSASLQTANQNIISPQISKDWCIPLIRNSQAAGIIGNKMDAEQLDVALIRLLLGYTYVWSIDESEESLVELVKPAFDSLLQIDRN